MTTIRAFITRHPVATYFALTFAISWGGVLLVIGGPGGMTGVTAQDNPRFPLALLAMIAGPSVSGVLLTGLIHGRAGFREFRSRLLRWRVGARWYAVALLTAPLLSIAVLVTLSLVSPEFLPGIVATDDKAGLVFLGLAVGLSAGIVEELGWTGFAIPHLTPRFGVLATGLIVGMLWSAWHLLAVVWGIGNRAEPLPLALFVTLDGLSFLPAFRVLMVWVYARTESLLVGILMHLSLTACTLTLWPATTGASLLAFDLAVAGSMWLVVAAIAVAHGGQLSRQPLQRRAA